MFQLRIEGLVGAKLLLMNGWPTRTVSLLAPSVKWLDSQGPHHLIVRFEDIDEEQDGFVAPSVNHIARVLDFTRDLTSRDKLLVNCHMGCRRSPAMALGILVQHGMTPAEALDHVKAVRPVAWPNPLVTKLVDEHLDLKGELSRVLDDFLSNNQGKLFVP